MPKRSTPPDEIQHAWTSQPDLHRPQADDRQRVAQRAYERFQMRGGEPGRDQEDWFEAEREVRESRERKESQ